MVAETHPGEQSTKRKSDDVFFEKLFGKNTLASSRGKFVGSCGDSSDAKRKEHSDRLTR
jgi:hypothetical protein